MKYLRTNKGLVTIVDGEPVVIEVGQVITLMDEGGNTLFCWEQDEKVRFTTPSVERIGNDGVITLAYADYVFDVAMDETMAQAGRPVIKSIGGTQYSTYRTFVIDPPIGIMVTPERRKIDAKE